MSRLRRIVNDRKQIALIVIIALIMFSATSFRLAANTPLEITPPSYAAVEKKRVSFAKDVRPIFVKHCYKCHGAKKQESGFRLDIKADALTGGERGASIIPGNSKKSLLIRYIAGLDPDIVMPPEDDELTKKQIATLRAWIDQGADWPAKKK
jgi:uncharacterized membrane protein